MSRKLFTEEQMASLRQNPYVYSVSSTVLVLRKSFKEIFYKEYMEGAYPKAILKKYGFDTTMLGKNRIDSIVYHIKKNTLNMAVSMKGGGLQIVTKRPVQQNRRRKKSSKASDMKWNTCGRKWIF